MFLLGQWDVRNVQCKISWEILRFDLENFFIMIFLWLCFDWATGSFLIIWLDLNELWLIEIDWSSLRLFLINWDKSLEGTTSDIITLNWGNWANRSRGFGNLINNLKISWPFARHQLRISPSLPTNTNSNAQVTWISISTIQTNQS